MKVAVLIYGVSNNQRRGKGYLYSISKKNGQYKTTSNIANAKIYSDESVKSSSVFQSDMTILRSSLERDGLLAKFVQA